MEITTSILMDSNDLNSHTMAHCMVDRIVSDERKPQITTEPSYILSTILYF
jgi:hypothetical protein